MHALDEALTLARGRRCTQAQVRIALFRRPRHGRCSGLLGVTVLTANRDWVARARG